MLSNVPRLLGRIALVTGSTAGIGFSIAERLAIDGAKVIVSSRNHDNVQKAVDKLQSKGYEAVGATCHIGNKDERTELVKTVEKLGGLDIFVQCAGVNPFIGPILNCPESAWDKTFNINLKSNYLLTQELFHLLKESKYGRVVYNSSLAALMPWETLNAYTVSKAALLSLTQMVSLQLGHYNVTCNCIIPGMIDTPFGEQIIKDKVAKPILDTVSAIKRVGKPEDVCGVVAFLASDEASYISGECIAITGGFPARS